MRIKYQAGFVRFLFTVVFLVVAIQVPAADMTPNDVLNELASGNDRYLKGESLRPNQTQARRTETTVNGQHPYATVIACSDSRVPVEFLFDAGIGDIFVIRVAGNVADVDEIGSIEYGVDHLGTPVLVALGHTHCGAVTAVVQGAEVHGSIPRLVDNIIPAVEKVKKGHPGMKEKEMIAEAVKQNVWQTIQDLLQNSSASRQRVKSGKLMIVGAVYDINSGKVAWMGTHPDQDRIIFSVKGGMPHDHHH